MSVHVWSVKPLGLREMGKEPFLSMSTCLCYAELAQAKLILVLPPLPENFILQFVD